jgi:hypothetical protein
MKVTISRDVAVYIKILKLKDPFEDPFEDPFKDPFMKKFR